MSLLSGLVAQCPLQTQATLGHLGPDFGASVVCFWDADGAGPQAARLFVGGSFTVIERSPCAGAGVYDLQTRTWSLLPAGTFDVVTDAAVDAAFRLVVVGSRTQAGQTQHRVARWNGTAWTVLGGTFDGPLSSVAVTGGGDVIVGGEFQNHGAQPLSRLARWNGTAWQAIGGGVGGVGPVHVGALCVLPNGDLVAGGTFATAGGATAANIARWNGTQWQALGAGQPPNLTSIVALPNGDVFATGFASALPARWNGSSWTPLTGLQSAAPFGAGPWVSKLAVQDGWQGPVVTAMGVFGVGNLPAGIAAWDPVSGWVAISGPFEGLAAGVPQKLGLAPAADWFTMAAAGPFYRAGGVDCSGVAMTSFGSGAPLGDGIALPVTASGTLPDGDLVIAGPFLNIGNTPLYGCASAEPSGTTWTGLPGSVLGASFGVPGALSEVRVIADAPDGSTLFAGSFATAGGVTARDVARFDGSSWRGFGATAPFAFDGVRAVLQRRDGQVFAGGNGVARWNGSAWIELTGFAAGLAGTCYTLAELPNGDVLAGGDLQFVPGGGRPGLMRWNGAAWTPIGTGLTSLFPGGQLLVTGCASRSNGGVFAIGSTGTAPFVALYDGSHWQLLPAPTQGTLRSLVLLPDGDLVVGGEFDAIGGVPAASLARWDGIGWQAVRDGVRQSDGQPGIVYGLHFSRQGELHVAGDFSRVDGAVAVNFVRLRSLCAAGVASFGAGCSSSGGPLALTAAKLPWLGAQFVSRATGLPANGVGLAVVGFGSTFVALSAILPTGGVGCALWTTPDRVEVALPQAGAVELTITIPNSTWLLGQVLHQQVLGLEFGSGGSLGALTGSNRLTLTFGVF
ncbi:MAG: hypothetical protein MUC36_22935 [Planctomycetes bacterium]|nr:hypothetical protein [Planctomycetota bacterium]